MAKQTENQIKANIMGYGRGRRVSVKTFELFPLGQDAEAKAWADQMIQKGWLRGCWLEIKQPKVAPKAQSSLGLLISLLTAQTQDQKAEYISRTGEWAASEFDRTVKWLPTARALVETVLDEYKAAGGSLKGRSYSHPQLGRPYCDKAWYSFQTKIGSASAVILLGKETFIKRAVAAAEAHYHVSIEKLAMRIEVKGLDTSKLTVTRAQVKQNLETTITDGQQTVRAFTILAWGMIVRPHYRYLIKQPPGAGHHRLWPASLLPERQAPMKISRAAQRRLQIITASNTIAAVHLAAAQQAGTLAADITQDQPISDHPLAHPANNIEAQAARAAFHARRAVTFARLAGF